MIMQTQLQSNQELCNLLVQGLIAKDEKLIAKVLESDKEEVIKDIVDKLPVIHVRKFVIELSNLLSSNLTIGYLQWLQHLLASKYSVITSMEDGRSILIPLVSLLEDRSSPGFYNKVQSLKGKLTLLKQLRNTRKVERAETIVRVPDEIEQPARMEVDSATDTDSDEDLNVEDNDDASLEDDDEVETESHDDDDLDEPEGDEEEDEDL